MKPNKYILSTEDARARIEKAGLSMIVFRFWVTCKRLQGDGVRNYRKKHVEWFIKERKK